jgi:hypothetical protein
MVPELLPDRTHPSENVGDDPVATRSIFRPQALEQYVHNQERAVFPRLVSPRSFRFLWFLATVLMILGIAVSLWPIIVPLLNGMP